MMNMDIEKSVYRTCLFLVDHFEECLARKNADPPVPAGFHSRVFSYFLHPERRFVFAGRSKAVIDGTKTHLEHVVPCVVLYEQACDLLKKKVPKAEIAKYLSKHWRVADISMDEAKRLDSREHLNLRQSMPEGWCFETGDTYERFKLASIELHP